MIESPLLRVSREIALLGYYHELFQRLVELYFLVFSNILKKFNPELSIYLSFLIFKMVFVFEVLPYCCA